MSVVKIKNISNESIVFGGKDILPQKSIAVPLSEYREAVIAFDDKHKLSVEITTEQKMSITDFGAIPNGIFDSTNAINKAFDFGIKNYVTILIPDGVFYSKPITVNGNLVLDVSGYALIAAPVQINGSITINNVQKAGGELTEISSVILGDTGWVNPVYSSGWDASVIQFRKVGNVVYTRRFLASANNVEPNVWHEAATVDVEFRPPWLTYIPISCGASGATSGTMRISSSGVVSVMHFYSSAINYFRGGVCYHV